MNAKLLVLLLAAAQVGCGSSSTGVVTVPASSVSVPVGSDFTLAIGQVAVVNDGEVTVSLEKMAGDSRCPTNALIQCIWVGSVQFGLSVTERGAIRTATIESVASRDVIVVGKYWLQLISVSPARLTLDSIPAASYRGVFRVTTR